MRLIFLYGKPATGKLTVAQELHAITGYPVFHNHMVVDLLLPAFEFGSEPFVELREQIWLAYFRQASQAQLPGLIFTFAPEATVRPTFVSAAVDAVAEEGGEVAFVELTAPLPELRSRIGLASRKKFGKLSSPELFDELIESGTFEVLSMPEPKVTIDTSAVSPARAALEIARVLGHV